MRIYIIVLHFGPLEVTLDCLRSIFANKLDFKELVVVDNNQNFNLEDPKLQKKVKIIKNKKNMGFAGGVNVGIKYALSKKADYVLLLNNDTIIKQDFLNTLIKFSEKFENAGIVSPAIKFRKNGKFVYDIGGRLNKVFGRTTHEEVFRIIDRKSRQVDYVSGCAMLVKKEVFKKIGLFDEQFFLYYEDVDFCMRAKNKGFLSYVCPEVSIEHELSKSVGRVSPLAVYHQTQSAIKFGKKYYKKTRFLNLMFVFAQSLNIFRKNPKIGNSAFLAFYKNL